MELLFYHLGNKGVYIWEGRGCFISTAHTEEDVDQVVQAIEESIFEMREGGFLPPLKSEDRPATSAKAAAPSCLVKLRGEGTEPPLFFVPGVYGTTWYLSNLVRCIDKKQPVYGLHARGLQDGEMPHDSIEGMAGEYVEAIRTVLPQGPYLLAGHSTGAVVALETALQLQNLGQEVDLLAILDNPPYQKDNPTAEEHRHYDDARWMDMFSLGINYMSETKLAPYEELSAMSSEVLWNCFADWLRNVGLLPRESSAAHARNLLEVFKVSASAELVYRPREIYRGVVTLFRTTGAMEDIYAGMEKADALAAAGGHGDPTMLWSEVSSQPVVVVQVPGNHLTMVLEPHCQTLARRLTEALTKLQEKSEPPTVALAAN